MLTDTAMEKGAAPIRRRVRTPGKHIVLFALAVTFMLGLSTAALQKSGIKLDAAMATFSGEDSSDSLRAPVEEYLVDLAPDATGRSAFLRMRATIIARDREALAEIREAEPFVRERISFFLRELSADDFAGTEAMARVKAELLKRASLPLEDGAASDIIIEDIVIQ